MFTAGVSLGVVSVEAVQEVSEDTKREREKEADTDFIQ